MARKSKPKNPKATKTNPKGSGAKNKWDLMDMANRLDLVAGWARDGWTNSQMMNELGISHQLFYNWKNDYPDFAEALRKGKDIVDRQVENRLFERAMGYAYVEETKERMPLKDPRTGEFLTDEEGQVIWGMVTVKEVVKHLPPDTTAQIFWLKNRKPHEWRDKKQLEHGGVIGTKNYDYMTTEEIETELKRLEGLDNE